MEEIIQRADGVSISTAADQAAGGGESPASALHYEVVVARLDLGSEAVGAGASLLSAAELQRAARFRFERDRRRFIAARAGLRQLLAQRLAVSPETIEFVYGKYGKPALAQRGLQFNLSHSGDFAAYAFSRGCDVGIDIEEVRAVPDADAVAARMFSRCERDAYAALPANARTLGFLGCWTRKEAVVKALGYGLRVPLGQFDVSLAPGVDACWRLDCLRPMPGLIGAVACWYRRLH